MCCNEKRNRDDAVSELVGEMLMLTIVLILLAVFSATASNFLPQPRDPTVTIVTDSAKNSSGGIDVYLYHKGGDWIKKSDLTIIISDKKNVNIWKYQIGDGSCILWQDSQTFDLGNSIVIFNASTESHEVRLVTPRAVVFPGVVPDP